MRMDLSIIIASYNTVNITRRCLHSVFSQTQKIEFEVIVVDNNSIDGSTEMITKEFPEVTLIRNTVNLGFAAAQNIGLGMATGRFLLVLNSDVLFVGNPCKTLIEYLSAAEDDIGVIGPQIINPDGTIAPSARRVKTSKPVLVLSMINRHFGLKRFLPSETLLRRCLGPVLASLHDNYASHDQVKDVGYIDGMCAMFRREVLYDSGLFDEQFFFDYEIVDLSNRIRSCGWRIRFYPGAKVIHLGHASRKKISNIIIETHRSELIYYAKYQPHYLQFLKSIVLATIGLKIFILKTTNLVCGTSNMRIEALKIYRQIQQICLHFDRELAKKNEHIPKLHENKGVGSSFLTNNMKTKGSGLHS